MFNIIPPHMVTMLVTAFVVLLIGFTGLVMVGKGGDEYYNRQ